LKLLQKLTKNCLIRPPLGWTVDMVSVCIRLEHNFRMTPLTRRPWDPVCRMIFRGLRSMF
jgi:hypothetical protein